MDVLDPEAVDEADLEALRKQLADAAEDARNSRYGDEQMENTAVQKLVDGDWPMEWVEDYAFVSDFPDKAWAEDASPESSNVLKAIAPPMQAAREELTVISPYFVPGDEGTRFLVDIAKERRVRVLTNSLVANDVAAVHGGYSRWREALLAGGVRLYEMKPVGNRDVPYTLRGSSGASLHTKALSVDGERLFVGSYNLDPRSTSLNCEQGVLVASDTLARQFEGFFDRQSEGTYSWAVTLDEDGDLSWSDGQATFDKDPEASAGRRFQAWLARVFRIDSQL
jgi:putative cardiolipin synthase